MLGLEFTEELSGIELPPLREEEVLEEMEAMSSVDREHLRDVARNNLYFFSKGIIQRPDVNKRTHGGFCVFFQDEETRRRLGMMPRTHLKSTIATIDDSARLPLQDPNETRILIVGETAMNAQAFLTEIKGHYEKNKILRMLFPEVIPTRFNGPGVVWSQSHASLERETSYRDPTWRASGVGAAIVGAHFTRIKCDDLIGFEAARSPAAMKEAKDWCDNIEPLLIDQHRHIIDWIGTRWSRTDLYAHVMESYGAALAVFTRQAIEDGEIIFPEKHTWDEYNRLMTKHPTVWYAQYCNSPIAAGSGDLPATMLRNYRLSSDGEYVVFQSGSEEKRWNIFRQLDRVLCADPNSGSIFAPDFAATSVVGLSPDDEVFVLDSWAARCSASQFVDKIFEKCHRWHPRVVGIEKAGQQNTDHYFQKKARDEDFYVQVVPLSPEHRDKDTRIRGALDPVIRSGNLFLLPSQTALREQLVTFPDYIVIDEADALAYFTQIARRPYRQEDQKSKTKVINLMMRKRNKRTGY